MRHFFTVKCYGKKLNALRARLMMLFVEIMTMLDFVICRNGHIKKPVWSELGRVSGQRETAPIGTLVVTTPYLGCKM